MRVVAALAGNALGRPGEAAGTEARPCNVKQAAAAIAEVARAHELVVVHGNGPQVGLLALESEAVRDVRTYPLDLLGAEGDGIIGDLLEQELGNALPDRVVVSLLTEVVVDALDPAFRRPTAPIGPEYTEAQARELARQRGWSVAPHGDNGMWRRVVAAPAPRSIVELPVIRLLLERDVVVLCTGGGGIPVVQGMHGARHGVEAIVDEDMMAALLARQLDADVLLLLADAHAVDAALGNERGRATHKVTVSELRRHDVPVGPIRPKVDAATWFAATTGRRAAIGARDEPAAVLAGDAGTTVTAG